MKNIKYWIPGFTLPLIWAMLCQTAPGISWAQSATEPFEGALKANRFALALAHSDPSRQASLWADRVIILARAGRLGETQRALDAARSVAKIAGGRSLEEQVLVKTALELFELNLFETAAMVLELSVEAFERPGPSATPPWVVEAAHLNLTLTYDALGLEEMRQDEFAKLQVLTEKSGRGYFAELFQGGEVSLDAFRRMMQDMKDISGSTNFQDDNEAQEIKYLEDIFDSLDSARGKGGILEVSAHLKKYAHARKYSPGARSALKLFADLLEAVGSDDHHSIRSMRGKIVEMMNIQSLPPLQKAQVMMGVAGLSAISEDYARAAAESREAVHIFESAITDMRLDETISGLIDKSGHDIYRIAVESIARIDPAEAFSYAERGRAWRLRQLLERPRQTIATQNGRTKALTKHERQEYETQWLRGRLINVDGISGHNITAPVSPDRLRHEVLDHQTTLVAFFPGIFDLWIWAIDHSNLEITSIPMSDENWHQIACLSQALRWEESPPSAARRAETRGARLIHGCDEDKADPAAALYLQLIDPIVAHLRGRHLIIVPYGTLHHVPFAALRNPETGQYLVQDFSVSLAPSASALEILSRRGTLTEGEVLVLGNPITNLEALEGAHKEAATIAQILNRPSFLEKEATESRVYEKAGKIGLLHLATHGQYESSSPRFSRLLLTADTLNDGRLEMHEVWDRLDLSRARLVVLSGCETALGEVTRGDEVRGLTHAFLVAGSQAVISTLWPVDDAASADLMVAFYQRYLKEGATAADALRHAQLEMLKKSKKSSPYYWAGFTLTGYPLGRWLPVPGEFGMSSPH